VSKVVELCRADASEFVRRAAVQFISQFLCTGTTMQLAACLVTVSDAVVHDVDGDVRCATVRFWRQYLPRVSQSVTSSCCWSVVLATGIGCLLSAVSDCDRPVRLEALGTLANIRTLAETRPHLLPSLKDCSVHDNRSSCDRICTNPDLVGKAAGLTSLRLQSLTLLRDEGISRLDVNCADTDTDWLSATDDNMSRKDAKLLVARQRVTLLSTDWESLLASESQQSGDCHAGNPMSLLDDILKTARRDSDVSNENTNEGDGRDDQDSIIIDCY